MQEFEDNTDIDVNVPLDLRFVFAGLAMLSFGLTAFVFIENAWIKYLGLFCFVASFFVMTQKRKNNLR